MWKSNQFDPKSKTPFKLSRSKIDLFLECPRCFYLDRRCNAGRPKPFPFNLNSAVDHLLKKEFDMHRTNETTHPLMKAYGIKAVPFQHENMNTWRENFVGIQYLDKETNLLIFGAVDDLWINENEEIHVVDYKATSKDGEVDLDSDWQIGYKRQVEVYQWLLRKNDLKVSDTAYFVYANGLRDKEAFDGKLEFSIKVIPYEGKANWIDTLLPKIKSCLMDDRIPKQSPNCDYCTYVGNYINALKSKK